MTWLKEYRKLPHVPDDGMKRMRLLVDAETRLADVLNNGAVVTDVSGSLRARNDLNHFSEGLQLAFGGTPTT